MINKYQIASRNINNLDEKGYRLGIGKAVKRITRICQKSPMYRENGVWESCTVVESIAADGFSLTPLIIFRGENQLAGWHKSQKEIEFWFGNATKGFNNSAICLEYFEKIFEPETHTLSVLS